MDLERCFELGTTITEETELKFGLEGRVSYDIMASKYCQKILVFPS